MIIKDIKTNKYIIIQHNNNIKSYYYNIVFRKYGINLNQSNINYVNVIKNKINRIYNKTNL